MPVLLARTLELLAPAVDAPGAVVVDATLGLGGHSAALLAAVRHAAARRPRPGPAGAGARGRAARAVRRPGHPRARGLRRARRRARPASAAPGSRACCSTSGSRRCSSTRPVAASPTRRTRRWTCGWTRAAAPPRPRWSTPTRPTGAGPGAAGVRRGAVRPPDRRRRRPRARDGAVHRHRAAGRAGALVDPGRDPAYRRPSRQAHLPGAAHRGQRRARRAGRERCPPPSTRSRSAGRIVVLSYHSLEDRMVKRVLRRRGDEHRAARPARRPGRARAGAAAADPRRRGRRATRRSRRTRAPPRSGCAPPSVSGTPHEPSPRDARCRRSPIDSTRVASPRGPRTPSGNRAVTYAAVRVCNDDDSRPR